MHSFARVLLLLSPLAVALLGAKAHKLALLADEIGASDLLGVWASDVPVLVVITICFWTLLWVAPTRFKGLARSGERDLPGVCLEGGRLDRRSPRHLYPGPTPTR